MTMQVKKLFWSTAILLSLQLTLDSSNAETPVPTPAAEIESFLRKEKKQNGSFIITAADPEDNSDNFQSYLSECTWSVEKKTFAFNILDSISSQQAGKFLFAFDTGFTFVDTNKKQIEKSGPLDVFYRKFWNLDGKLDIARAFDIKKTVIMDRAKIHHLAYTLSPKGAIPLLPLKVIEVDLDEKLERVKYLKFQINKTAYIWSEDK